MATWNELVGYLATNYSCTINGNLITLPYSFPDGRTQNVYVSLAGNEARGEWVHIASAIADTSHIGKLEAICREIQFKLCGGIVVDGNFIVLRDALPLMNLNDNEIGESIDLIVNTAEEMEKKYIGADNF